MRKFVVVLLAIGCLAMFAGAMSMPIPGQVDLQAQKCDPKDPKCDGGGTGCSPGYWKNHLDEFEVVCLSVSDWTCDELLTAITCKGSDSGCRRSEAAAALNEVNGCTE